MTLQGVIKHLAIVTAVFLAALNYVAWVRLGFAGKVPDLELLGMAGPDILKFVDALKFEGRQLYRTVYLPLDFGFILCITLLLYLVARAFRPVRHWHLIIVFAALFCLADLGENLAVSQAVNDGPFLGAVSAVDNVAWLTRIKFLALISAAAFVYLCWKRKESLR